MFKLAKILTILSLLLVVVFSAKGQVNIESQRGISNKSISNIFKFTWNYSAGNSDYLGVSANWTGMYKKEKFSSFIITNLDYKSNNNKRLVNKAFLHLREMYDLNSIFTAEVFQQVEFQEFIKLNFRSLAGADARINFLDDSVGKHNNLKSAVGIGIMYEYEDYNVTLYSDYKLWRSTNYLSLLWKFSESASFDMAGYFQPCLSDFENYRILFDSNLKFKVGNYVRFVFHFDYRHDNQPVEDVEKSDLSIKNGIEIAF